MIILSIPFLDVSFVTIKHDEFSEAFPWQEFRLDYNKNPEEFPEDLPGKTSIITIRDIEQNGVNPSNISRKMEYYTEIVKNTGCLVDLELRYEINIPSENVILSHHDLSGQFNFNNLKKLMLHANSRKCKFLKLAVPVNSYNDLNQLEKLINLSENPVLIAGLGTLSKQVRILHRHLGAVGTYIGLDDHKVIEDQLTCSEARIYGIGRISEKTKISGIVGGRQVDNSLGLSFYNNYFQNNKIDAVYLPFPATDFPDLWNWCKEHSNIILGLSITMPFKKTITSFIETRFSAANFFSFKKNELYNTDLDAFCKAIEFLELKTDMNILILGTGGSAETAVAAFEEFDQVTIAGRDPVSGEKLTKRSKGKFIETQYISDMEFDVIINCTPLGMNRENPVEKFNLELPLLVIDLPYLCEDTPLIQLCKKNNIRFVDGKTFWKWQSVRQLEELCS